MFKLFFWLGINGTFVTIMLYHTFKNTV